MIGGVKAEVRSVSAEHPETVKTCPVLHKPVAAENLGKILRWCFSLPPPLPPEVILESHDVVFRQVLAQLHLDDFQDNLAGVFQAVPFSALDKSALATAHRFFLGKVSNAEATM